MFDIETGKVLLYRKQNTKVLISLHSSLADKFAPCYSFTKRYMSRVMRKQMFCICENKDADQLRGNREADQHLCFRYTDSL